VTVSKADVTRVLSAIEQGDPKAADRLLPLVYDELRKLAAQRLTHEAPGQTLQATALVHEAYLRLVDAGEPSQWQGRGHFFAAAAEAMRRILVDAARRKRRPKHGGDRRRVDADEAGEAIASPVEDLLVLDDALEKLAAEDRTSAELVKLKYFAGLSLAEAAEALGLPARTAGRRWAYARAWLQEEMLDERDRYTRK
jgi:RNA polymerase sigma factor (TIGR02999 family)